MYPAVSTAIGSTIIANHPTSTPWAGLIISVRVYSSRLTNLSYEIKYLGSGIGFCSVVQHLHSTVYVHINIRLVLFHCIEHCLCFWLAASGRTSVLIIVLRIRATTSSPTSREVAI